MFRSLGFGNKFLGMMIFVDNETIDNSRDIQDNFILKSMFLSTINIMKKMLRPSRMMRKYIFQ